MAIYTALRDVDVSVCQALAGNKLHHSAITHSDPSFQVLWVVGGELWTCPVTRKCLIGMSHCPSTFITVASLRFVRNGNFL